MNDTRRMGTEQTGTSSSLSHFFDGAWLRLAGYDQNPSCSCFSAEGPSSDWFCQQKHAGLRQLQGGAGGDWDDYARRPEPEALPENATQMQAMMHRLKT
ncbi:hypothetical protein [Acidithiobacillus concretivorus]|uniref:hypothetical protein n=1 Tax=Acidithiobacillus concretivorus TaxID=3063952 RepID=UPI001C07D4F7|nr:hypothetical protein [Acidithiobacillus concretivorus]